MAEFPDLPSSPIKVDNMWGSNAYNVGGLVFTLDDIEHGVLRENRGHPAKKAPCFAKDDPRLKVVCSLDPRIHFALNCGANSCPPIKVYSGEKLDRQLGLASSAFLKSSVVANDETKTVSMSKLLYWYRVDFGSTDQEVFKSLASMIGSNAELKGTLLKAADQDYAIEYADYDWSLNDHSSDL